MSLGSRIAEGLFRWHRTPGRKGASPSVFTSGLAFDLRSELKRLTRQERWLAFTEFLVLLLTAAGFVAASWPQSVRDYDLLFHIRPADAIVSLLGLLLLFQAHAAHRHWRIRRERKRLLATGGLGEATAMAADTLNTTVIRDSASSLGRRHIEDYLGKEIARARRTGRPLSLLILSIDDIQLIGQRYGRSMVEHVFQEFTYQLKRATRGCDFATRLAEEVFLAVLCDCPVGSVQHVLDRVSPLVLNCDGKEVPVACSAAWVDFQAGETPGEMITRAQQMLQLYKKVDQAPLGPVLTAR